ncbi:cell envelope biogenesis protein TolA [Bartonella sp. B10]
MDKDPYHNMKQGLVLSLVAHALLLSLGVVHITTHLRLPPQQLETIPITLASLDQELSLQQGELNVSEREISAVKPTIKPQEKEEAQHVGDGQVDNFIRFNPKEKLRHVETTLPLSGEEPALEKNLLSLQEESPKTKAESVLNSPPEDAAETAPEVTPASPPEDAAETAPEVTPASPPEDAAETAPEVTPASPPEDVAKTASEVTPASPPEDVAETAPEVTPASPPEDVAETAPEVTPASPPEDVAKTAPEVTPASPPEDVAKTAPEVTPASPPEDVAKTVLKESDSIEREMSAQKTSIRQQDTITLPNKSPLPQFKPKPAKQSMTKDKKTVKKEQQQVTEETIEHILAMEEKNLLNRTRTQGGGAKRSSQPEALGAQKNIGDNTKMAQTLVSIAGGCIQKKLKLVALGGNLKNRPVVRLRFYLNRKGMVVGDPIIDPISGEESQQDIMIRQVYAAVFSCQPYADLPRDQYDLWGQGFDFDVDPLQEITR